jgi:PTS system N-acetylglucosamine-specific IIC component
MFVFGTLNRLLIPTGLHHIINFIAWFQVGDFTDAAGKVANGDLKRFFAGDHTAGMFMTGFFPIMMFGLPAACFAMVHEAKGKNKAVTASILLTAAFASFLTGVTEPIEFAFMFIAPLLYLLHALLTGLSMAITYALDMRLGFGFSAGLIDYIVNWKLSTNAWMLIPVGLVYSAVYYFGFRAAIRLFNLKTPGREDDVAAEGAQIRTPQSSSIRQKAELILPLIGGPSNVVGLDACVSRLRLMLKDESLVNEPELKKLGAAGIMRMGKGNVQIVFGTDSELIKEQMKTMMPA